jgi:hypothetical protein
VIDRWREIGKTDTGRNYIDMETFDDTHPESIKLWIKQARGPIEVDGPYVLQRFELNCRSSRIRTLSIARYDAAGNLISSREGGSWAGIIPDTYGETLHNGVCRAN